MEGSITKNQRLITNLYEGTAYVSGTDGNLDNPNSALDQSGNYCPIVPYESSSYYTYVAVGSAEWGFNAGSGGEIINLESVTVSAVYGLVRLYQDYDVWFSNGFASSSFDGLRRIYLPKSIANDQAGGYFDYYYSRAAWLYAFVNTASSIVFDIEGSVYKGSISADTLVVTYEGFKGPAGGGSTIYVIDFEIPQNGLSNISDELISITKHKEHIIL